MAERKDDRPLDLGLYARGPERPGIGKAEIAAVGFSAVWLVAVGLNAALDDQPMTAAGLVMTALAAVVPLVLVWAVVATARSLRALRDEAARLQSAVDAMRAAYVQNQQQAAVTLKPSVERKIDEIAQAARQTETVLATFTSRRDPSLALAAADRRQRQRGV
ncbi:MAG: hypothetical protein IE927_02430, partial [Rhodobacterales bacterium]|nr:hypothetical protein [Rhodobacterales bacterium]